MRAERKFSSVSGVLVWNLGGRSEPIITWKLKL